MHAEILTIGTELLLGEIVDTNSTTIARALRDIGLDIFRTTSVGDNVERIAAAVQESLQRAQVVITTGGLGPTVDDPTRAGVALALGVETVFHPELWEQIQRRFAAFNRQPTENNRLQAYLPAGAASIENPVGTAPAFRLESGGSLLFALPGVPGEMRTLLQSDVIPYLCQRFDLQQVIKARILHTSGVGESWLDEQIADLETLANPSVGLAAHAGQVDIRITAKADSEQAAAHLIGGVEKTLRQRLGETIYGADEQSLEGVILQLLADRGLRLVVVESGTQGALSGALEGKGSAFSAALILPGIAELEALEQNLEAVCAENQTQAGIGLALLAEGALLIVIKTPGGLWRRKRSFGGVLSGAPKWARNLALDALRKRLLAG